MLLALLTVGKHARRGELHVRKSSQVVEDGAAVTLPLGVIHKGSNVVLLAMVTNPRADYHGNIIWHANKESKWKHLTGVMSVKVNSVRVSWWILPSWELSRVDEELVRSFSQMYKPGRQKSGLERENTDCCKSFSETYRNDLSSLKSWTRKQEVNGPISPSKAV